MPNKIQELIKDTKFEATLDDSHYNRKEDIVYLLDGADEYEVIHEIGHSVETKLNIFNNENYLSIQKNNIKDTTIVESKNYNINIIKDNTKFVSELQRMVYDYDIKGHYKIDYATVKFNYETLGEYFSEGFRVYFENSKLLKLKDNDLYKYIRGLIK